MTQKKPVMPKHILSLMTDFEYMFGVQNWERGFIIKEKKDCTAEELEKCAASITIDWKYRRVMLTLYPNFWLESRQRQRLYLLHEYCHLITSPLVDMLEKYREGKFVGPEEIAESNEHATSQVTEIVDSLLRLKNRYARIGYQKYLDTQK